ncbi:MAG: dTDP-4-dehydrorhamnose 3,5-epimerase family protein [Candidatus Omnitrophica bacterium]|nr:dTDP-4-dehydrorhamnose 3,5-epimerase family protein [Candidatus Omnitrophota bacterium]MCM8800285.1 dTDP-4-dehydrorhamnose 3,5-epimerase family protein [Candidatus Omnitrophota bacterium]
MIKGVITKELIIHNDERGRLMEILRCDDKIFKKFGQVYITTAFPSIVKAWHYHKKQDDHFCCIKGKVRLALYDARKNSSTFGSIDEFILSMEEPKLIRIPKGVYHGFKCISTEEAIVLNIPTLPYNRKDPDEYRVDPYNNSIPYDWRK